jgi:AcrR family transcriptional regulator
LASTTVRDVAAEMGTSSGLIHHYFESMDDVLASAFEMVARQDLAISAALMGEASSAVEALRTFFRTYTPADKDWAFQLWLDAWAEAARRPAVQTTSRRLNLEWQGLLERTIRSGSPTGRFVVPIQPAPRGRILVAAGRVGAPGRRPRDDGDARRRGGMVDGRRERELGLGEGVLR